MIWLGFWAKINCVSLFVIHAAIGKISQGLGASGEGVDTLFVMLFLRSLRQHPILIKTRFNQTFSYGKQSWSQSIGGVMINTPQRPSLIAYALHDNRHQHFRPLLTTARRLESDSELSLLGLGKLMPKPDPNFAMTPFANLIACKDFS